MDEFGIDPTLDFARYNRCMLRFRLRSLLFAMAALAAVLWVLRSIARLDDPLATIVVSADAQMVFTAAAAIELTKTALRQAEFEPVRPVLAYGDDATDPESFVGRNVLRPDSEATVIWNVRNNSAVYGVRLDRTSTNIIAQVYRHK